MRKECYGCAENRTQTLLESSSCKSKNGRAEWHARKSEANELDRDYHLWLGRRRKKEEERKALEDIYKIYTPLHRYILKITKHLHYMFFKTLAFSKQTKFCDDKVLTKF